MIYTTYEVLLLLLERCKKNSSYDYLFSKEFITGNGWRRIDVLGIHKMENIHSWWVHLQVKWSGDAVRKPIYLSLIHHLSSISSWIYIMVE